MTMDLGFIGLGNMGVPMATRLLSAGHPLTVYDVSEAAMARLAGAGARAAGSPAAVADQAGIVFLSLPAPEIVLDVVLGPAGVIEGKSVRQVVDLSTSGAPTAQRLAEKLAPSGIALVDAPVSGGVRGASAGTLAVMVACARRQFEVVEPLLANLGRVFYVGTEPGLGQTMKLVNNYLSATAMAATAEAMVFGVKAGLDAEVMLDVVNAGSGRNSASQDKFPRDILPRTFGYGFATALMCKDLKLFTDQADSLGVPLWIGSAIRQFWQFTNDQVGGDKDFTTMVRPLENWAGVEVRPGSGGGTKVRPGSGGGTEVRPGSGGGT
jgi:3-hydroxyisobutyrate dehydrogenase-like beta-hydroxyacid dehydrogenase